MDVEIKGSNKSPQTSDCWDTALPGPVHSATCDFII